MEECELCGKRVNDIYIVNVEEVELRVCTKCAQGKKIVSKVLNQSAKQQRGAQAFAPKKSEFDQQLLENYGAVMHSAREAMKIPIKVLAEMLSEKETHLLHVEQQKTLPSEELRKKLERALGIKLVETAQTQTSGANSGKGDKATLGDFIEA